MNAIKVGDIVAYRAKFLRDIVDLSKSSADKRGKVLKIESFGKDFQIAHIDGWNSPVNIKNICKVGEAAFGDNKL